MSIPNTQSTPGTSNAPTAPNIPPASNTPWPKTLPDPLASYYHDHYIRSETGQPLFVSASFTDCYISPIHSHETLLLNSCPHKTIHLYLEIPPDYWENPRFNPETGFTDHITWLDDIDVTALTGHNPTTVFNDRTFSSPLAVYGQRPARSSQYTYPIPYDPGIPVFRLCPAKHATDLFIKIPWRTSSIESLATSDAIIAKIREQFPKAIYIHAVNTYLSCGVDYWILPIRTP